MTATLKKDFGCELVIPGSQNGEVIVYLADVEQEFLGLSLTEKDGLNMRRVSAELRDLEQITKLRDSLSAFIQRKGKDNHV